MSTAKRVKLSEGVPPEETETDLYRTPTAWLTERRCPDPELLHGFEVRKIRLYGKWVDQPRRVAFFAGYRYSGATMPGHPLSEAMVAMLLRLVNGLYPGAGYNSILFNAYAEGRHTIGAHSDDEKGIDPAAGVLTLSWGAQRKFRIRCKGVKPGVVFDTPLKSAYFVCMGGRHVSTRVYPRNTQRTQN